VFYTFVEAYVCSLQTLRMLVVYYIITTILTKKLVMATDDQCQFKSPFYPGESCEDIYNKNPESHDRPGYYWILRGPRKVFCGMNYTGSSCEDIYNNNPETGEKSGYYRINDTQWTYCNMTAIDAGFITTCAGVGGGWRRIIYFDTSIGGSCPIGWRMDTYAGVSFCRLVSDEGNTCSSAYFSTNGTSYQRVCGRARGYQKGRTTAFFSTYQYHQTIDGHYADGLLITYNNPRKHIWTYTCGGFDNHHPTYNCPCAGGKASSTFVGADWYCESGAVNVENFNAYYFNDPLWDGSGCITSRCCDNPSQPWFYRELNEVTTSDIEARICNEGSSVGFDHRAVLIDQFELYIQ